MFLQSADEVAIRPDEGVLGLWVRGRGYGRKREMWAAGVLKTVKGEPELDQDSGVRRMRAGDPPRVGA